MSFRIVRLAQISFAARRWVLIVAVLAAVLLLGPLACGSSTNTRDLHSDETFFDQETREKYLARDRMFQFKNDYMNDPPDLMPDYIERFSNPEIGQRLRDDLIDLAQHDADPNVRANMMYMLARANFPEMKPTVFEALSDAHPYTRYRAVMAFPFVAQSTDRSRLESLIGPGEEARRVRERAQDVYTSMLSVDDFQLLIQNWTDTAESAGAAGVESDEFRRKALTALLAAMEPTKRAEMERWMTDQMGRISIRVDDFVLETRKGQFQGVDAPCIARAFARLRADAPPGTNLQELGYLRRLAVTELYRIAFEANPPENLTGSEIEIARLELADFLMLGHSDAAKVAQLLDLSGLDLETQKSLASYATSQPVESADECPRHVGIIVQLLARRFVEPTEELAAVLLAAAQNRNLQSDAIIAMQRLIALPSVTVTNQQRRRIVEAMIEALKRDDPDTLTAAVHGLSEVGGEAAVRAMLDGVAADVPARATICAAGLVGFKDRGLVMRERERLWMMVRTDAHAVRVSEHSQIAALNVLAEIGHQDDLDFLDAYANPAQTAPAVATAIEATKARIQQRLPR